MIRFTWFGLVCCGVANWAIYLRVASPEKYLYMVAVLLVSFVFVGIHRHFTRYLVEGLGDYDEDHVPLFIMSSVSAVIVALIVLIVGYTGVAVGILTSGVGFILAGIRESKYV